MHFLGLAGMPRRIPDYPDIYASWNFICTVGYLITVIGIALFILLLVYPLLVLNYDQKYKNNYFVQIANYHTFVHGFFFKISKHLSKNYPWTFAVIRLVTTYNMYYYLVNCIIKSVLKRIVPYYSRIPAWRRNNGAKQITFFPVYNFFNTMQNYSTSYLALDRAIISIFLIDIQTL
jgi:magnesium-transporting ATPase (P-type)